MFDKVVITNRILDRDGTVESVTLGFFDAKGVLQLELPQVSGKLFPTDVKRGKEVVFNYPATISNVNKK